MAGALALAKERLDALAQRSKLCLEPGELVFVVEVGAVAGDDLARCPASPSSAR